MIAIIDYNIGNIAAVANMLRRIGEPCQITANPAEIKAASHIILPGNGSFDACMRNLRASGLIPVLEERVINKGVSLLGICVGAQMLGLSSDEGVEPGLGWLNMRVHRIPASGILKVPHMGWNRVTPIQAAHHLTQEMQADARFYFTHSYYMEPAHRNDVLLEASYGIEFAAGICKGNIAGVQFHPEKSHKFGKQLLTAFAKGL